MSQTEALIICGRKFVYEHYGRREDVRNPDVISCIVNCDL